MARGWLEIQLLDGEKLLHYHKQRMRSYLANWVLILIAAFSESVVSKEATVTDRNGENIAIPNLPNTSVPFASVKAAEGNSEYGILFGSGTKAVSLADYDLEAAIAHGSGSGQLYYYGTEQSYELLDSAARYIVTRSAVNQSGADITVSEVGLACRVYKGADPHNVLVIRDVLDTPQVVANGKTITARYILEFPL